jgi:retron-type reverse transcriptase
MADNDKKKLYKQIVRQAEPHLILERMRVHGFWPVDQPLPEDPAGEAAERAAIEAELQALRRQHSKVADPDKALAEERIRRWQESKQRRAERRQAREAEAEERRQRWAEERLHRVYFLGEGVSGGLGRDQDASSDEARLVELGLPLLHTGADLARAMEIKLGVLRWLTFHRRGAALVHYHRYQIPKRSGGQRLISAPKPQLAQAQHWVLEKILSRLATTDLAHGFVKRRSIVSNAAAHVGQAVVANMDLADFFPSVTFRRVKGLFQKRMGYSEQVATVLALLTTEPPRLPVAYDGRRYWAALGERRLPQGACTSPALTNLVCRRLDHRLDGLARSMDFTYTRYADDLTFSGDAVDSIGRLLRGVRSVLTDEGFDENRAKTRIMRRGRRQEVTGVVVNDRPTVSRTEIRRLRAILHNCARHGLESQNRSGHPHFAAYLRGKVAYVAMVDPVRGQQLQTALASALATVK